MNDIPSNVVNEISRLMCEMDPTGLTNNMSGGTIAQDAPTLMTLNQTPVSQYEEEGDCPEFSDEELQCAKDFISKIGGDERARELIDKAIDCEDCLGMVGDGETEDEYNIELFASSMSDSPDMPSMNRSV